MVWDWDTRRDEAKETNIERTCLVDPLDKPVEDHCVQAFRKRVTLVERLLSALYLDNGGSVDVHVLLRQAGVELLHRKTLKW